MSMIHSRHWNEKLGMCTKHNLRQVPCPRCLTENDPDIEVGGAETRHASLSLNPSLVIRDLLSDSREFDHAA